MLSFKLLYVGSKNIIYMFERLDSQSSEMFLYVLMLWCKISFQLGNIAFQGIDRWCINRAVCIQKLFQLSCKIIFIYNTSKSYRAIIQHSLSESPLRTFQNCRLARVFSRALEV